MPVGAEVVNQSSRAELRSAGPDGGVRSHVGVSGGQGSRALSRPMRDDAPAARITPQKLLARMKEAYSVQRSTYSESAVGSGIANGADEHGRKNHDDAERQPIEVSGFAPFEEREPAVRIEGPCGDGREREDQPRLGPPECPCHQAIDGDPQ